MTPDTSLTTAIIQARMGSRRLPGKVLLDIAGQPMLARVVARTRQAKTVDLVIVATTTEPDDDPVAGFCSQNGILCYRGSLHDVLDRYYRAARAFDACGEDAVIVRITADCPLIDPQVIDKTVEAFLGVQREHLHGISPSARRVKPGTPYDFAANRLPPPWGRTYPIGLDTEVCTFQALETAWREAREPHQREHVMPFFYDHQERFRILLVDHEEDFGALRWTVDTPEDLKLVRQIYARFPGRDDFSWLEVLDLFQREPELARINAGVRPKTYDEFDDRRPETTDGG
jgi:spore coat polysaccharide biosynthesis protein SpsF